MSFRVWDVPGFIVVRVTVLYVLSVLPFAVPVLELFAGQCIKEGLALCLYVCGDLVIR